MRNTHFLTAILLFVSLSLSAQVLNGEFRFNNGFYDSHDMLLSNQPAVEFDTSSFSIVTSDGSGQLFAGLGGDSNLPLNFFEGKLYVVTDGKVYINANETVNGLHRFVLLSVLGRVAMFERETVEKVEVPIKAYNPLNKKPFREGVVEKETRVNITYLLLFDSGRILPFTYRNFLAVIKDDEKLLKTVENLEEEERMEKLYKCLLIYNDRYAFELRKL